MVKLKIAMGDIVEISRLDQKEELRPYITRVEDFDQKNTVLIHTPIVSSTYVRLPKEDKYLLKFICKKNIYCVNASVSQYKSEGNIQFIELKLSGKGKRVQQREFFRLPCLIPLEFSLKTEDESEILFSEKTNNGIVRDLSGGGMKLVSNFEMAEKNLVKFNLSLQNTCYELVGEIVHKACTPDASQQYTYGVMFLGLSKSEQEKIIKYLHNLQLRHMQ